MGVNLQEDETGILEEDEQPGVIPTDQRIDIEAGKRPQADSSPAPDPQPSTPQSGFQEVVLQAPQGDNECSTSEGTYLKDYKSEQSPYGTVYGAKRETETDSSRSELVSQWKYEICSQDHTVPMKQRLCSGIELSSRSVYLIQII